MKPLRLAAFSLAALAVAGCVTPAATSSTRTAEEQQALATFDALDFEVFSGQQWSRIHESHGKDIVVHWPDGHTTTGVDVHVEDLKAMFVYAPDTRITVHPIKLADGPHTSVTGVMEGTFTQPMPIGNGQFIQPTGKAFKVSMNTVGVWKDGVMVEEYLFWDNQTFMKQLGLAP